MKLKYSTPPVPAGSKLVSPVPQPAAPPTAGYVIDSSLIVPPRDQLSAYADSVSGCVEALNDRAVRLAEGFGMAMTPGYNINPETTDTGNAGLDVIKAVLHRNEYFSIDRKSGRWAIFYSRDPSAMGGAPAVHVSLRDAPLDVREKFLQHSAAFFDMYLQRSQDRLAQMKSALTAGGQTLAMLDSITLK